MKFWGTICNGLKCYTTVVIISSFKLLLLLTVAGLVSLHNDPSHKLNLDKVSNCVLSFQSTLMEAIALLSLKLCFTLNKLSI